MTLLAQSGALNTWEAILLLDIPDSLFPTSPEGCFGLGGLERRPKKPGRVPPWASGPVM